MKRYIVAAGVAAFGLAGFAHAGSPVYINEIRVDHSGSDTDEYFELHGPSGFSLDGYSYVVIGDDSGDGSGAVGKRSGVVEYVLDLTGSAIPADGFFLAATSSFGTAGLSGSVDLTASLVFENSDNVTHMLVRNFSGALGDILDTDRDGTIDVTPWGGVEDSISLVETDNANVSNTNEWDYSGQFGPGIGPDGNFVPGHVYRTNDGGSAWGIGEFGLGLGAGPADSPGTSNVPTPGAIALLSVAGVAGARRRR